MRSELTAFGAQVLASLAVRQYPEERTPLSLTAEFGCPERDMVNTLNWLKDLGLVNEKYAAHFMDGRCYEITELGIKALELHDEQRQRKTLPPFTA